MKKTIILLLSIMLISGCSSNNNNNNDNNIEKAKQNDFEQMAICNSKISYTEEYNKIENTSVTEIYSKNDKITKIVMKDIYTSPTYEEYKNSIAIDYNRKMYESAKNTDGITVEYSDDYDKLVSTYKVTYVLSKLTYAEKDEIGYQKMLNEDGELLKFSEFVELYKKQTGLECTIENIN